MNERGQIFTLDMFFALTLTALVVSYSGLALEQAREQAESYALRYSLERTANDAADVLVKTLGKPENWAENAETLETPGFAEEKDGNPVLNAISIVKFGQLRRLTNSNNWVAPVNASAVQAIKNLFGGSEKFEVRILDENENELWHAFPRWFTGSAGENSGAENSTEVVVVRRLVAVRYGSAIRADSRIVGISPGQSPPEGVVSFEIFEGENEAFDWYIVVTGAAKNPNVKIRVNDNSTAGGLDYGTDFPKIYPDHHGGINVEPPALGGRRLEVGLNQIAYKFTALGAGEWGRVYVVALPHCSDWKDASMLIQPLPATLEVKMWR